MISVDISNVWCSVTLPEVLGDEKRIFDAHMALGGGEYRQNGYLGWMTQPDSDRKSQMTDIVTAAEKIRGNSQILVVVGTGAVCAGAKAVIRLTAGRRATRPRILFVGDQFSTEDWLEVASILENEDFSVLVTSPAGNETAPLVVFRALRWIMEKRYGEGTKERIYLAPGTKNSILSRMAEAEGYRLLEPPTEPGGTSSLLTPAGLLILAVAGRSPGLLYDGAREQFRTCDIRSLENPAWLYAAARTALIQKGCTGELLCSTDPAAAELNQWWSRLLMAAGSKDGAGCLPLPVRLPGDFRIFGDMLLSRAQRQFATMLRLPDSGRRVTVEMAWKDTDGLNNLAGQEFAFLAEKTQDAIQSAMSDASVPFVTVCCEEPLTDDKIGELVYFMEFSSALAAKVSGVDPVKQQNSKAVFDQLGRNLGR